MKPGDAELRAEIQRLKAFILSASNDRRLTIEAAAAAVIVSALRYALGELPRPTVRTKI